MKLPIGIMVARKELVSRLIEKEFSAKTSIKLKLLARETSKYVDMYEEERIKLVKKYGSDVGGQVIVPQDSEHWEDFVKELADVANQQVDVLFPEITEEELTANPDVNLSARDLIDMEVFYVHEEMDHLCILKPELLRVHFPWFFVGR